MRSLRGAKAALETLSTEAAVAIENARLYREAVERAKLDQELKVAAAIQQSLLPPANRSGAFFCTAGTSVPCRSVGGDFFDFVDVVVHVFQERTRSLYDLDGLWMDARRLSPPESSRGPV